MLGIGGLQVLCISDQVMETLYKTVTIMQKAKANISLRIRAV